MALVVIRPGEIYEKASQVEDKNDLAVRLLYIKKVKLKRDLFYAEHLDSMAERVRDFGMDRALHGKIAAKYSPGVEQEVHDWIHAVTGIDIGVGRNEVENSLKSGQTLCIFMQTLINNSPAIPPACQGLQIKYNTMSAPFKQMENIEIFLKAAEKYGVPRTSLFQVVDLYEARNMAAVLSMFLQLGTEAQRCQFQGPAIGPKPTEKHNVQFSVEQLKAGESIIGLQAGTNKCASQAGMRVGPRHIADIPVDAMSKEGECVIGLQAGTNKCASQKGMNVGPRHIDNTYAQMDPGSHAVIGLQAGSNQGASQAGMKPYRDHVNYEDTLYTHSGPMLRSMAMGANRQIMDQSLGPMTADGQAIIGLQMGTNQGASQSGMSMGKQRFITDF